MYEVLKHVPEPELVLRESKRVLRPGGRLVTVGPNLFDAGPNLSLAVRYTLLSQARQARGPNGGRGALSHPSGNTRPEAGFQTLRFTRRTVQKLRSSVRPLNRRFVLTAMLATSAVR